MQKYGTNEMQYEPYVGILHAPPTKEEREYSSCWVCGGFEIEEGKTPCTPQRCSAPYRF